jgi:hypothetical protein
MYTYRANVTLVTAHRDRAVKALQQEVRRLSQVERGLEEPDWTTMQVEGPLEVFGPRGEVVFEYRGVVRGRNFAERQAAAASRRTRPSPR